MLSRVVFASLFSFALSASFAAAQSTRPTQPVVGGPNGRFQIVNATPDQTRNIMLLDTVTGDTWLTCTSDGATGWCPMSRFTGAPAATPTRKPDSIFSSPEKSN